jgi:predicted N-acetyltransferase YhbS
MTDLSLTIRHEMDADAAAIERLHARAFGPGRFARTAYRLREGVAHEARLSFVAMVGSLIVGSIRLSPLRLGAADGLMLGPLTVDPAFTRRGIGRALIERSLEAARGEGHRLVLLVGDEPYYARAGFSRVPRGRLAMPGPVDADRLLMLELQPGAFAQVQGAVRPGPARSSGRTRAVEAAFIEPGDEQAQGQQSEP